MQKTIHHIQKILTSQVGKSICLLLCFVFINHLAAQADPDPIFDGDAPVDGGLSLLIAGGVGYGVKKLRAARKSK
jgi:hypothetical protein